MADKQYLNLVRRILAEGETRIDRTGVGTKSVFGAMMRFSLSESFPILTTKKVWWPGVVRELLWMLSGETSIMPLIRQNVNIWTDWCHAAYVKQTGNNVKITEFKDGLLAGTIPVEFADLGPVYGKQWRRWSHTTSDGEIYFDQMSNALKMIRETPESRRIIVSAWNVGELSSMLLPPCHAFIQFYVSGLDSEKRLNTSITLRSNDVFLGTPFNIAQYALLTHLMAHCAGIGVGELVYYVNDAHIYLNHIDAVNKQLERDPLPSPRLEIAGPTDLFQIREEHIHLKGYQHHSPIKGDVAV